MRVIKRKALGGFLRTRCLMCGVGLRYSTEPHDCDPKASAITRAES